MDKKFFNFSYYDIEGQAFGWEGAAWARVHLDRELSDSFLAKVSSRLRKKSEMNRPSWNIAHGAGMNVLLASRLSLVKGAAKTRLIKALIQDYSKTNDMDIFSGLAGMLISIVEFNNSIGLSGKFPELKEAIERYVRFVSSLLEVASCHPVYMGMAHGLAGHLLTLESLRYEFGLRSLNKIIDRIWCFFTESTIIPDNDYCFLWSTFSQYNAKHSISWCHGASGISLAISAASVISKNRCAKDISDIAQENYVSYINQLSFDDVELPQTYCCGLIGVLQTIIYLGSEYSMRIDQRKIKDMTDSLIKSKFSASDEKGFWYGQLGYEYLQESYRQPLPLPLLGIISRGRYE